jgi:predicted metalloprotease with PDZ domain
MSEALKGAIVVAIFLLSSGGCVAIAGAQGAPALSVALDATQAAQKIYHVKVTMAAQPGPFTFVYPKWIPGYHGPVGPIEEVVSLKVSAAGAPLAWRRDLVDSYAVQTTVPAGASNLEVDFDVVTGDSQNGQTAPVGTSQLALLEYSNFVVYPQGATAQGTHVDASVKLPAGWTFGTALPVRSREGQTIAFAPATLYTLIDSPIIAGAHEREYPLGGTQYLDVASDSDAGATLTPKFLTGMKHLVEEGPALYGGRHYRDYHFLLTLSDAVPIEGIEHHESSDDRSPEKYAADDANYPLDADLLPHEYSHSWNGKYRRPGDLSPPDYQQPELTDLLWVYEGMNQYNGEKLAARSRLIDFPGQLENLALSAASMDVESGRDWRPIRDTADEAPILYVAPRQYAALRRSAGDFYTEGDLIWLDADVTIRRLTNDAKSLDDFERLWGDGSDENNAPVLRPYDENDVLALMNSVVRYDWAGFFKDRIDTIAPHAPLDGITGGGYKLVYTAKESELEKGRDAARHQLDESFSLGMILGTDARTDGSIRDILTNSPAFNAGLAPDMKIVAVDGRAWSSEVLHDAMVAHKGGSTPLQLIVSNGDFFKVVQLDASEGERFPHLERDASKPDELQKIYAPLTFKPDSAASPAPEKH